MMLYTILPSEMLDTIIPEEVKQFTGYDKDYTLREAAFQVRELDNGYFLVSCKLCNAKYIANKCVESEMSEQEIAMAKAFYGEENVFEDYSHLTFKDELSDIEI